MVAIAVKGGATTRWRSSGVSAIRGRKAAIHALASAQVMCIFQLPAITGLCTLESLRRSAAANLRSRPSVRPSDLSDVSLIAAHRNDVTDL